MGTGNLFGQPDRKLGAICGGLTSHLEEQEQTFLSGNGKEIEVKWQPNQPADTKETFCNNCYLNYKYLSTIVDRRDIERWPVYRHPSQPAIMYNFALPVHKLWKKAPIHARSCSRFAPLFRQTMRYKRKYLQSRHKKTIKTTCLHWHAVNN